MQDIRDGKRSGESALPNITEEIVGCDFTSVSLRSALRLWVRKHGIDYYSAYLMMMEYKAAMAKWPEAVNQVNEEMREIFEQLKILIDDDNALIPGSETIKDDSTPKYVENPNGYVTKGIMAATIRAMIVHSSINDTLIYSRILRDAKSANDVKERQTITAHTALRRCTISRNKKDVEDSIATTERKGTKQERRFAALLRSPLSLDKATGDNTDFQTILPNLFDVADSWIYDSGASDHVIGSMKAEKIKYLLQKIKPLIYDTAGGKSE